MADEPPLPWAWHVALWCYDPVASHLAGRPQFRRPFPGRDWNEDVRLNGPIEEAMQYVVRVHRIYEKDPDKRSKEDEQFIQRMISEASQWQASMI